MFIANHVAMRGASLALCLALAISPELKKMLGK